MDHRTSWKAFHRANMIDAPCPMSHAIISRTDGRGKTYRILSARGSRDRKKPRYSVGRLGLIRGQQCHDKARQPPTITEHILHDGTPTALQCNCTLISGVRPSSAQSETFPEGEGLAPAVTWSREAVAETDFNEPS